MQLQAKISNQSHIQRFKFDSIDDIINRPPLDWVIDNLIPSRQIGIIGGESGSGKSFVALHLAFMIASGLDWFERQSKQGHFAYIAAEGNQGMRERILAGLQEYGCVRKLVEDHLHFISSPVQLLDDLAVREVIDLAQPLGDFRLIIVDTLGRSLEGGEENSNDDIHQLINNATRLAQATGATVIFIHHHTKHGKKGILRGASALRCDVDFVFDLEKTAAGIVLQNTKLNDGGDRIDKFWLQSREVQLRSYGAGSSCIVMPGTPQPKSDTGPRRGSAQRKTEQEQTLLDVLPPEGAFHKEWKMRAEQAGITKSQFNAQLKNLKIQAESRYKVSAISALRRFPSVSPTVRICQASRWFGLSLPL